MSFSFFMPVGFADILQHLCCLLLFESWAENVNYVPQNWNTFKNFKNIQKLTKICHFDFIKNLPCSALFQGKSGLFSSECLWDVNPDSHNLSVGFIFGRLKDWTTKFCCSLLFFAIWVNYQSLVPKLRFFKIFRKTWNLNQKNSFWIRERWPAIIIDVQWLSSIFSNVKRFS